MIERLLKWSLAHPFVVVLLAATVFVLGVHRARAMPVDVFPDLTAPRVTIVTEATGLATEEIEAQITFPVEAAVQGAAGLRQVRSASAPGISVVWAEFDWATDPVVARQRVTERLNAAIPQLPPEAEAPLLAPASSVMGEIAFVALTSKARTPTELRRIAEVMVRRRLLAVPGVGQVVAIGGLQKEYVIELDPHRLHEFQLSISAVVEAVEKGSHNAPGGYVVEGGTESVVRVLGRADNRSALASLSVAMRGGRAVRLRDLGRVTEQHAIPRGTASFQAEPAVMLSVVKQPAADTLATTGRLDAVIEGLKPELARSGVELHPEVFRQVEFIDRAIENLLDVVRDGALLVVLVLWLFLWSLRPTVISLLSIPTSLMAAIIVLDALGFRIDTMTLGGLAIAIGELVDDAIVDVENVVRRLRAQDALPAEERAPAQAVVLSASREIRSTIVSATWVLMLVFVPILWLEGLEGRLLRPLAVAYLAAIFASLLVAVTLTPVLCLLLLPGRVGRERAGPVMPRLVRAYRPILRSALASPRPALGTALVLVIAGGLWLFSFGRSFLPAFNEGSLTIGMVLPPGTSLEVSDQLATMAERALLRDPGVVTVGRRTGRAERDEHVLGVESSELEVRLATDDPRDKETIFHDIRERLRMVPGAHFTLGQPISHRIEHMVSGQRAALAVKVFGQALSDLRAAARTIETRLQAVPGLVDVQREPMVDVPQWHFRVDAFQAAELGLSAGEAARALGAALWGLEVGRVYEEQTTTPVRLRFERLAHASEDRLRSMLLPAPNGAVTTAGSLAHIERRPGPNFVLREGVVRRTLVTANIEGGATPALRRAVTAALGPELVLPPGVHVVVAGEFARTDAAATQLRILALLALAGVVAVVGMTLGHARRATIVLSNLPFALAGGALGVALSGATISVASAIGFITLFGIAVRNGLLLATRVRDLEAEGVSLLRAVEVAAEERLAPILMTAMTAALGLLPLALAIGQPGSEIQAPMAWVILTGLVTSTALNMWVVPALLAHWGGASRPSDQPA